MKIKMKMKMKINQQKILNLIKITEKVILQLIFLVQVSTMDIMKDSLSNVRSLVEVLEEVFFFVIIF